ncbi:MAG TPA: adenylate kinase [Gammaproteobacteria bacterium]|jgi:adenylate kinase|nr:adenylate kinase [Gammaproteobacteria bacterium]
MRTVLLGAPGSGKGTQAQQLQRDYRWPQVSTGDLLRAAVAKGTELGLKAKAIMDAGDLVSDDLVLELVRDRLADDDADPGFILDGFPRNRSQARDLEAVLSTLGKQLDCAVLMDVSFEMLMKRLTGRRTCSTTGKLLNVYFSPQAELDECIAAGGELLQRADDSKATIGNRLEVYERETAPLIDYYREAGILRTVQAEGTLAEVYARLLDVLGVGE